MSNGSAQNTSGEKELDPYSCLCKRGPSYAKQCEEVYLSNSGGTSLSENFQYFVNLEVVWFNNNRLTRLVNLEPCFRIREMYLQNNRLVSLSFLKHFKFLRVLLASNNQISNLTKQLQLLSRQSFLKKLELFDNSVADEPEYRLRMIYHAPQIEILDRLGVTMEQRQRAAEVVPNMDLVALAKPVRAPKKAYTFTSMEADCFRTAKAIRTKRQEYEENLLKSQVFAKSTSDLTRVPQCRALQANMKRWSSAGNIVQHEMHNPTPWEKQWDNNNHQCMQAQVEQIASSLLGKDELNKEDVAKLAQQLHEEGVEDFGRALRRPDVFAPVPQTPGESTTNFSKSRRRDEGDSSKSVKKVNPLEALTNDAEATLPMKEVVAFLLCLEWSRLSHEALDRKIAEHNSKARLASLRATFGVNEVKYGQEGDDEIFLKCRDKVARLEGLKTRKSEVGLLAKPEGGVLRRPRSDFFSQSFIKPKRGIDEATGRTMISVAQSGKHTRICG